MSQEEKLKKGCGAGSGIFANFICKRNQLCIECKAQLKGFQIGKAEKEQEVLKIIKKIDNILKQIDEESSICKKCKELSYCSLHMLMYRRIEKINEELKSKIEGRK